MEPSPSIPRVFREIFLKKYSTLIYVKHDFKDSICCFKTINMIQEGGLQRSSQDLTKGELR